MDINDIIKFEWLMEELKNKPIATGLKIFAVLALFLIFTWVSSYISEKGKQQALENTIPSEPRLTEQESSSNNQNTERDQSPTIVINQNPEGDQSPAIVGENATVNYGPQEANKPQD